MKQVQSSVWGKGVAWAVLVCALFAGVCFGMQALQAVPYLNTTGFQDTQAFTQLLKNSENLVAERLTLEVQLEDESLSYAERFRLTDRLNAVEAKLAPSATNFRYVVWGGQGIAVDDNLEDGQLLNEQVQTVHYATLTLGEHATVHLDETSTILESTTAGSTKTGSTMSGSTEAGSNWNAAVQDETESFFLECGVPSRSRLNGTNGVDDAYLELSNRYDRLNENFSSWLTTSLICLAVAMFALVYILWTAGHKKGTEEIVLTWQENIFFDGYLLFMAVVETAGFALLLELLDSYLLYDTQTIDLYGGWFTMAAAVLCVLIAVGVALTLRTLAVRLKAKALARTTLLCRGVSWFVRTVVDFFRNLNLTWKTAGLYVVYFLILTYLGLFLWDGDFCAVIWLILHGAVLVALCWWTLCFQRIQKGSQAIAAGALTHQIDTQHMPPALKKQGETLNNISVGMQKAVEERIKSERFKAELITNVSHDLKTPLTSIINYVDLLKTTEQTDQRAVEYIAVLERKSQRLKKLTEDLVEASKASTGVLAVEREKIGLSQLIDQALGEWREKLEASRLTVVVNVPEGETWVYADGRHLWRVIDNLLSNCAKYALEGTRVYVDLSRGKGQVELSVKNISREPLNIPPERLMERFVRGEESRSTEGSGLGLSIARSLTQLQGGTFDLTVDGDLFKAVVTLPQAN
jgi:signal transduction histidine kinase